MAKALDGINLVEFDSNLGAAYAAMLLAENGARAIKVEPPGGDFSRRMGPPFVGGESAVFLSVNRNKESVALDFKHPDGRAVEPLAAALRDVDDPDYKPIRTAVETRTPFTVDLLYGDFEGGQRMVSRVTVVPRDGEETAWLISSGRHWNIDRPEPR